MPMWLTRKSNLDKANRKLKKARKRVARLQDQLRSVELERAVLLERLDLVANYGLGEQTASESPLHKTEEEEDLEYALTNGLINRREYEDALAQAGFDNTEIYFDGEIPQLSAL